MDTRRDEHSQIFRKCAWRLTFILVVYFVNYLDRVNVGFAALTMNQDLGFSPAVFGFGAGVFFLGYFLFQVPGNLIMQRFGARHWMFSIMMVWGLISAANARSFRGQRASMCCGLHWALRRPGSFPACCCT